MNRLALPNVTLCAAASVNVAATVEAMLASVAQAQFAEAFLFTHSEIREPHPEIHILNIPRLASAADYSEFLLHKLVRYVKTSHCLVVQWDGFILDVRQWTPDYLKLDYIGAPWPQFVDGQDVGNGGFSLRSKKLLEACLDPRFVGCHPEDVIICRSNRTLLEKEHGIVFANRRIAERFSYERGIPSTPTFGFHGIFNMVSALGPDRFWAIYEMLDDRRTATTDYGLLMRQLGNGKYSLSRRAKLTVDKWAEKLRR